MYTKLDWKTREEEIYFTDIDTPRLHFYNTRMNFLFTVVYTQPDIENITYVFKLNYIHY
jgi:hypothetical protein